MYYRNTLTFILYIFPTHTVSPPVIFFSRIMTDRKKEESPLKNLGQFTGLLHIERKLLRFSTRTLKTGKFCLKIIWFNFSLKNNIYLRWVRPWRMRSFKNMNPFWKVCLHFKIYHSIHMQSILGIMLIKFKFLHRSNSGKYTFLFLYLIEFVFSVTLPSTFLLTKYLYSAQKWM
jgi:hypothetical protein